jgi:hypothetical protein
MNDADCTRLRTINANIAEIENRSIAERRRFSVLLQDLRAAREKLIRRVSGAKPWHGLRE